MKLIAELNQKEIEAVSGGYFYGLSPNAAVLLSTAIAPYVILTAFSYYKKGDISCYEKGDTGFELFSVGRFYKSVGVLAGQAIFGISTRVLGYLYQKATEKEKKTN